MPVYCRHFKFPKGYNLVPTLRECKNCTRRRSQACRHSSTLLGQLKIS